MTASTLRSARLWLLPALAVCAPNAIDTAARQDPPAPGLGNALTAQLRGRGQCAIYVQSSIEHGLWQL